MSNLSPGQLIKYEWRVSHFLNKYKHQEQFELVDGRKVRVVFSEDVYHTIQSKDPKLLTKIRFSDQNGPEVFSLSSFKKTFEFGGRPDGTHAGAQIESYEIQSINLQLDTIKNDIGRCCVPLLMNGSVLDVSKCIKTPGVPKSDFTLIDREEKEIGWISHKKGTRSIDFQNWGGMTEATIKDHPESQEFISEVKALCPDGIPKATTIAKPIKDINLHHFAVYGIGYNQGYFSKHNVNVVLQGSVSIIKSHDVYKLDAHHIHYNGEQLKDQYQPVFMSMYKGDRSNFGVSGARFAIQPRGSRYVKIWL